VGEIFVITARTEAGKGNKGITSFIVTKDTVDLDQCRKLGVGHSPDLPKTRGVRAGKKQDKMGWRASDTRELIFEDAVVPKENILGRPGYGCIGIAALSLGIAEGAYEEALHYAGVRKQFGRPIGSFQGVSFQLADMAMEIEAGTHLLYHAAWLKQNGRPFKKEAAMAKLFCSELAMRATTKAVQIFGGYGYTTEYPVERMMRDAKVCEIGEGTSEIQRIVIARHILGETVD
jgi:butyryl-CoA dehydrogenase